VTEKYNYVNTKSAGSPCSRPEADRQSTSTKRFVEVSFRKIFLNVKKNSHELAEICKESKRFAEISHTLTNAEWSYTVDKRDVLGDSCVNDPEGAQFFTGATRKLTTNVAM